jgi:DNA invertase Pin-like site-specific DNA recombinase
MAVIGYMRVSTQHQKFDSQKQALEEYGVDKIYRENESGRKKSRSELNKALSSLKPGDTFVIFKLDRLSRGTQQLLALLESFNERNIQFVSIQNNLDTSTATGKFFFTIMSAFAEMESELIRERVLAGLYAAKKKGVKLGRPKLVTEVEEALELYYTTDLTIHEICRKCDISTGTLYNHLKRKGIYRSKGNIRIHNVKVALN